MRHRTLARPSAESTLRPVRGPRSLPLHNVLRLRSDPASLAHDLRVDYGEVAFVSALGRDVVVVQGPEALGELVRDADRAFRNEPVYGFALGRLFERGILLMDSDEHRTHRRIMQAAFTADRLAEYQKPLHALAADAARRFTTGPAVDIRAELKATALDVALELFVGARLPRAEADEINAAFVDLIEAGGALVRVPIPGTSWARGHRARRVVDEFFAELVPLRRATPGPDLMSALCEARDDDGNRLSDEQIVDHMRFMLFAAHDTATIAMTSMTYRLGRNDAWRSRVTAEAIRLGSTPTAAELRESTVMQAVFKESLRLRPPVPVIPRAAVRDTAIRGHFIPAGAFVIAIAASNHRIPEIWPQPNEFDPRRFVDATGAATVKRSGRHRLAWAPFGGGAHQCIGMNFSFLEAATMVHHMVRHLDWTVESDAYERDDVALTANVGFTASVRPALLYGGI